MIDISGILSKIKPYVLGWIASYLSDQGYSPWVMLNDPMTSTSWDGDSYSTTAKTKIDLSAVFGAPAGIKAAIFKVCVRDAGSSGGQYYLVLSPNAVNYSGFVIEAGKTNDEQVWGCYVVPCEGGGDIYYQVNASGSSTMDIWLEIWGYLP